MSRLAKLSIVTFCLSGLLSCSKPEPPLVRAGEHSKWTMLVFLSGANDLERKLVENLNEIASVQPSKDVAWVVQLKRTPGKPGNPAYTREPIFNVEPFADAKRFNVGIYNLEVLQDLGDVNMGVPAALEEFIAYGIKNFPADRYALILGDHGDQAFGFGWDETKVGRPHLTVRQVADAIEGGLKKTGVKKLDLIDFDACFMSGLEVTEALHGYAHYLVSSEEAIPGAGEDYKTLRARMQASLPNDGKELGVLVVDTYMDFYRGHSQEALTMMSVIDLHQIDNLTTELKKILPTGQSFNIEELSRAREGATKFGPGGTGGAPKKYVDLYHFLTVSSKKTRALEEIWRKTVVYNRVNPKRSNIHGISVYFPFTKTELRPYNAVTTANFGPASGWNDFLKQYSQNLSLLAKPNSLGSDIKTAHVSEGLLVFDELDNEQQQEAGDLILAQSFGKEKVIVAQSPQQLNNDNELAAVINDNDFFYLSSQAQSVPLIADLADGMYMVPYHYRANLTAPWSKAIAYYSTNGKLISLFESTIGYSREIPLDFSAESQEQVAPIRLKIDGKTYVDLPNPQEIFALRDIQVVSKKKPVGNFAPGFLVRDLAGNTDVKLSKTTKF